MGQNWGRVVLTEEPGRENEGLHARRSVRLARAVGRRAFLQPLAHEVGGTAEDVWKHVDVGKSVTAHDQFVQAPMGKLEVNVVGTKKLGPGTSDVNYTEKGPALTT